MTEVLTAQCVAGEVVVDGFPVSNVEVIGEGGASTGVVVFDKENAAYIPNTSPDMKELAGYVSDTLMKITSLLTTLTTGILPANAGGKIVSETFYANIAETLAEVQATMAQVALFRTMIK